MHGLAHRLRRLAVLAPVLLGGCATSGTFQTAHPLAPGEWEAGGDLSAGMVVDPSSGNPTLPLPRATVRAGLTEGWDLGGSLGIDGFRLNGKGAVVKRGTGPLTVSLSPGLRLLPLPNPSGGLGLLTGLEEAVFVGLDASDSVQVVAVARSAQDVGLVDGNMAGLIWAGGSLGVSLHLADGFRLMPEVGGMVPVLVLDGDQASGFSGGLLHAGLGVGFGKRPR